MTDLADERDLVARMRSGDGGAFEAFAGHYVPALYRFAASRARGQEDLVKEVVQTAICRFIEKLDTFRGEGALMTWLCTVVRNEIAGHYRKQQKFTPSDLESERAAEDDPEAEMVAAETQDHVHAALDHLPPAYARALEWKYIDGLSVNEIGLRMGIGTKAAESLLTRARVAFRSTYERLRRGERQ